MALRIQESKYPKANPVTRWSKWDESFITGCKEYPDVLGVGPTETESMECFQELLGLHFQDLQADRIAKPIGRPKKNNARVSANVDSKTRIILDILAIEKDTNIGKIIEEMVTFYAKNNPEATYYLMDSEYQGFLDDIRG